MIALGSVRVHLLNDGFFAMDGGTMFGIVPKPLWSRHVPPDGENRIPMSLNCPLALDGAERPADARAAAAYRHAPECLEPLKAAGLLEALDGPTAITPRLRVLVTGGHTPSHQCPILTAEGQTFVHLGDIAPTRAHL